MKYATICFWLAVACSPPTRDFNVGDFDDGLIALRKSMETDSRESVLADSISTLESLIRGEIVTSMNLRCRLFQA